MEDRVSTLIIAKPGRDRDCLRRALGAITSVEAVEESDDGSSALAILAKHQPSLVLLVTDPSGNGTWLSTIQKIRADWPRISCLVLADNGQQQEAAKAGGADGALLKCTRAADLFSTVERLLPREDML